MKGLVTKSTGSWYALRTDAGSRVKARLAGKIRLEGKKSTNPVVVGDIVEFEMEDDTATIKKIYPRKNYIIRKSLNLSKQTHILAANLDQAIIIATLVLPKTSTGFIDRVLVTCEAYSIKPILVFNKKDLLEDDALELQMELIGNYNRIGYETHLVSAFSQEDVQTLKAILKNKTSLIIGHSGVGKSTLINAVEPTLDLKTGAISHTHLKGMHTTTFTELFELKEGGFVIDSPGIKELGLVEMKREEVGHYFPEIRSRMNQCRFNNCTHTIEPACAVKEALENGAIDPDRFHNYLSILNGEEMEWNEWEN